MDDAIARISENPTDWGQRCEVAQGLYEAERFAEASDLILSAPEIPGDEENIVFAATIIGATDPSTATALLDQFTATNEESASITELRRHFATQEPAAVVVEEISHDSASVAPKKLAPPGGEREVVPTESAPVTVAATAEGAEGAEAARPFVIGEGQARHASDRGPDTKEKLGAVFVALIVHAVVAVLLGLYALSTPRPQPPQISVSSIANNTDETIDTPTLTKRKQKAASVVSASQPVVSSNAFSNFAVPDNFSMDTNLTMVSMSSADTGFGMSMSGFGEVSNMAAIPAGMQSRCSMSQRMKRLRESGGEDRAERAVRKGLEFLTTKQNEETGAFGKKYPVGMTGLALLAYLGHCETPESPKFGDSVVNAALYLMQRANDNDGIMTNGEDGHHESYEHAIATYALCELYTMTKESGKEIPRLESVLRKAVDIIIDEQSDEDDKDPNKVGGWPYLGTKGKDDMSVSGWNIQALKAAWNTGRNYPGLERSLDRAVEDYLPAIQDKLGAFKYSPTHTSGKESLTGAALLAMQIWKGTDTKTYEKGLAYLSEIYANPSPGGDYYAPYYNTQAFFMEEGEKWENYNSKFQPKLLDAQNDDGSWLRDNGGNNDNQIKNTAWAILMLEVYYRYLPTTDKVKGLGER